MTQSMLYPTDSQSAVTSSAKPFFPNPELLDPRAVQVAYHIACLGQLLKDRCEADQLDLYLLNLVDKTFPLLHELA